MFRIMIFIFLSVLGLTQFLSFPRPFWLLGFITMVASQLTLEGGSQYLQPLTWRDGIKMFVGALVICAVSVGGYLAISKLMPEGPPSWLFRCVLVSAWFVSVYKSWIHRLVLR